MGVTLQVALRLEEPPALVRRDAESATLIEIDSTPKTITRYRLDARLEHVLEHSLITAADALQAAGCSTYAAYVSDVDPTVPTECDFCHDVPEAGVGVGDL